DYLEIVEQFIFAGHSQWHCIDPGNGDRYTIPAEVAPIHLPPFITRGSQSMFFWGSMPTRAEHPRLIKSGLWSYSFSNDDLLLLHIIDLRDYYLSFWSCDIGAARHF